MGMQIQTKFYMYLVQVLLVIGCQTIDQSLIQAIRLQDITAVKKSISGGANPNAVDLDGTSALNLAVSSGNFLIVETLVEQGASLSTPRDSGMSPLSVAVLVGNVEIVKYLLQQGAPIEVDSTWGNSPLSYALDNSAVAEMLLKDKRGTELLNKQNGSGITPLIAASRSGNFATAKLFLDYGADVNIPDKRGKTALIHASENCHIAVSALLINAGADLKIKDSSGATAKELFERNCRIDWAQVSAIAESFKTQ